MEKTLTRAEQAVAWVFLGVLMSFWGSIICIYLMGKLGGFSVPVEEKEDAVKGRQIEWQKLYPFTEEQLSRHSNRETEFVKTTDKLRSLPGRIYAYLKKWVEAYAGEHFFARLFWVKAAKLYEKFLGWNMASMSEYNGVVTLSDGYLVEFDKKRDVSESVNSVVELAGFCKQREIDFLYVNAPSKICRFEDANVSGILDFSNQNADEFLQQLMKADVRCYDLREVLHAEGMSHHGAFYRTDHHWRSEIGFWAARHISQFLSYEYAYSIDLSLLNVDKFTVVIYPSSFLGSHGRKVTLALTEPDDCVLFYPKYPTLLHYQIPDNDINIQGDFSITYNMSQVEEIDYYNKSPYGAYNYGDRPLIILENQSLSNDMKLLMIHDSFANCVIPFLALGIKNVDALDLRHFYGSVRNYIDSTRPDIVVVLYNENAIGQTIDWQSHTSTFDFR